MTRTVELEQENAALRRENARLQKDKERLDWAAKDKASIFWNSDRNQWCVNATGCSMNRRPIRAAIDAAIRQQKKEGKG